MAKIKEGFVETKTGVATFEAPAAPGTRAPITIAVMGRAVLVELSMGFDLLLLVLETGPVAHLCQRGRVVGTVPIAAC